MCDCRSGCCPKRLLRSARWPPALSPHSFVCARDASATESRATAAHHRAAETCSSPLRARPAMTGLPAASNSSLSRTTAASSWCITIKKVGDGQASTPAAACPGCRPPRIAGPSSSRRTRSLLDRLSAGGREQQGVRRGQFSHCVSSMRHRCARSLARAERRSTRGSENRNGVHVERIRPNRGVRRPPRGRRLVRGPVRREWLAVLDRTFDAIVEHVRDDSSNAFELSRGVDAMVCDGR